MKIVYMGTPDFAVPALEKLIASGHEVGLVVTQPDRKRSRGKVSFSPVKETAVRHLMAAAVFPAGPHGLHPQPVFPA